jgi:hypothetical protein
MLAVLVVLAVLAVALVALVQVLELQRRVQAVLQTRVVEVAVLATNLHLLYQVTVVMAALAL